MDKNPLVEKWIGILSHPDVREAHRKMLLASIPTMLKILTPPKDGWFSLKKPRHPPTPRDAE